MLTFTWQHNNNDYSITTKPMLFGEMTIGSLLNIKMLDGQQFELEVVEVKDNVYVCKVTHVIRGIDND